MQLNLKSLQNLFRIRIKSALFSFAVLIISFFPVFTQESDASITQEQNEYIQKETQENFTENLKTHIFSFDLAYMGLGLRNQGWGFGITYEQYLFYHTALRINFGHTTMRINNDWTPTVSFGMFAETYPFSKQLDKFYIGFGSFMDFIPDKLNLSEDKNNNGITFISIYPMLGWKWQINRYISTDIFAGYKYILTNKKYLNDYKEYIQNGFLYSAGIKVHFNNIINAIKSK